MDVFNITFKKRCPVNSYALYAKEDLDEIKKMFKIEDENKMIITAPGSKTAIYEFEI